MILYYTLGGACLPFEEVLYQLERIFSCSSDLLFKCASDFLLVLLVKSTSNCPLPRFIY